MTKSRGIVNRSLTPDQRFENLYLPEPNGGCFLWIGSCAKGYGRFSVGGHLIKATRYAWEQANGPIPNGMLVCHRCDNPPCVNPRHLFIGSMLDNMRDQGAKGRNYWKNKTECKHGHPYTEGNTGVKRNGKRFCRTCDRIKDANRSDEQRARQNAGRKLRHHRAALAARKGGS